MSDLELPVLLKSAQYLARYPVPGDKRDWDTPFEDYAPIMFSAPNLFTIAPRGNENGSEKEKEEFKNYTKIFNDRITADRGYEKNMCYYPPIRADPEIYGMSEVDREKYFKFNEEAITPCHPSHKPEGKPRKVNRVSYLGDYRLETTTGVPLNPIGRTGVIGRGVLPKYGPHHAADPLVTCFSEDKKMLQLALIKRKGTRKFLLPSGMVASDENQLAGTAIRVLCEETLEGNVQSKLSVDERKDLAWQFILKRKLDTAIVCKVVDDPRNTDNAWIETVANWFHFDSPEELGRLFHAEASWVKLDSSFHDGNVDPDRFYIIIELFRVIRQQFATSAEFKDIFVPRAISTRLDFDDKTAGPQKPKAQSTMGRTIMGSLLGSTVMGGAKKPALNQQVRKDVIRSKNSTYPVPFLLRNYKYLARYPVPEDKRAWNETFDNYAPIMFTDPELFTMARQNEECITKLKARIRKDMTYEKNMCYYPPNCADPEIYGMTQEDREKYFQFNKCPSDKPCKLFHPKHVPEEKLECIAIDRVSRLGKKYQLHPSTGVPLNPSGRTGMIGRGLLGKYGPNRATDLLVTCFCTVNNEKMLQLALVKREYTGEWAIPGPFMENPGEQLPLKAAVREFCEKVWAYNGQQNLKGCEKKTIIDNFFLQSSQNKRLGMKKVEDPRNTDNAWVESMIEWFHFDDQEVLPVKLQAGDDAKEVKWVVLDYSFNVNSLDDGYWYVVTKLFRDNLDWANDTILFEGILVPQSIRAKLSDM